MKKLIMVAILVLQTSTICFAETFFWEDKKGVHITDDVSKLPPKFRDKYANYIKQNTKQEVKIPESAKNAVRALKKLEARCQTGVSFRDYSQAVGDAKFEVNMFVESNDAQKFEKLKSSIEKVIGHYETALSIWDLKGAGDKVYEATEAVAVAFYRDYPEARSGKYFDLSTAIRHVFSVASSELAISSSMINK